jgi:branched-chain amino acid transport system ATP-binding protein
MTQLIVADLHAHYGKSHVLQGVSFGVERHSITAILGRNGSGRSTTLKALMGIVQPTRGRLVLDGSDFAGMPVDRISKMGIAYVPEDRQVFSNLTVTENLEVGRQATRPGSPSWSRDNMFDYFPRLRERQNQRAGTMSGGEQQMLTLCRSLMGNPKLLLVDEPTEGLAPKIVEALSGVLQDIARRGVTILLVEQKLTLALRISGHVLVVGHGQIVLDADLDEFRQRDDIRSKWLDVS